MPFKKGCISWNKNKIHLVGEKNPMFGVRKFGKENPMFGKKHTKETIEKIKLSLKGKPLSEEHKKNIILSLIGRKHSEETKRKMSEYRKGRVISKEWRMKISKSLKGGKSFWWKGGISNYPYPIDWTKTLKISIRERDKYTCRLCGDKQGDKAYAVHHIDYNKNNCSPENLITLCNSCHSKTNNNREYWKNIFL